MTFSTFPPADADGGSYLTVTAVSSATAIPSPKFQAGKVITVVGRAAKVWGTVLNGDPNEQRPGIKSVWKAEPQT